MSGRDGTGAGLGALARRAARAGEDRAVTMRQALAAEVERLGGIAATIEGESVVLEGRGLLDRWIRDAGLRGLGTFS